MTRSPARSTPRYQTLADALLAKIQSGEYAIGGQFPTEFDICAQYSVSRHTARAALARLHALGLITRRPGAGTRVTSPTPPMRYQREIDSLDDLLQYGRAHRLALSVCERTAPPREIAVLLDMRAGAEGYRLFGLRSHCDSDEPICTTEVFLRPTRSMPRADLVNVDTAVHALFKVLDLRRIHHVDQTFDAVELPARHARLLGLEPAAPALRVLRVYFSGDRTAVGCATSLHPAGRFAYSMRLTRRTAP